MLGAHIRPAWAVRAAALAFVLAIAGGCRLPWPFAKPERPPPPPPPPPVTQVAPAGAPLLPIRVREPREIERDLALPEGTLGRPRGEPTLVAGDTVEILVTGFPELSGEVPVLPDGRILLEERRDPAAAFSYGFRLMAPAAGKTTAELAAELAERLTREGPRHRGVQVTLKAQAPRSVTLVATEPKAGAVAIPAGGTLLETLTTAGWNSHASRAKQVAVVRRGRSAIIDLRQVTELGQIAVNLPLEHNDILILLESDPISVQGAVRTPGQYPLPPPGVADVRHVLALAGGIKDEADLANAQLVRASGEVLRVDLNQILFSGQPYSLMLGPGDSLFLSPTRQMGVYVFGMVSSPGLKNLPAGSRLTHALASALPRDFGARITRVAVVRHFMTGPEPQIIHVNAYRLMMKPDPERDIVLEPGDVVYVPEAWTSDFLDGLTRTLAPLTTATNTSVALWFATLNSRALIQSLEGKN